MPYIDARPIDLGFWTVQPFGVLVATAVLTGILLAVWFARREGLDVDQLTNYIASMFFFAFLGSFLAMRLIYNPAETFANPKLLLDFSSGMSSFGGFFGAIFGAVLWTRFAKRAGHGDPWPYIDAMVFGFPLGWIFGRAGCWVTFDHPGLPTDFFLAQYDKRGVLRHNLGFEEMLWTAGITAVFLVLARQRRPAGFYAGTLCLLYAPFRFLLDQLRTVDVRYFGLTPGQYGSLVLIAAGLLTLRYARSRPVDPASPAPG